MNEADGRLWVVSGPPGSGKSTLGRRLADRYQWTYLSVGDLFRAEATRRGMTLEALGAYAEHHPEVDRTLDEEVRRYWRPGYLLDSRVHGFLARRAGVPVFVVRVVADPAVRADRVARRDGSRAEEAARAIAVREASERRRYWELYRIDVDGEPADCTVDSTHRTPEELAAEVAERAALRP